MSREVAGSEGEASPRWAWHDEVIVGREEELARLSAFLSAGDGPAAALLEGAAGIGKTTLWSAGMETARRHGYRVLACRPAGVEAALSYGALGDLIGPVFDDVLALLPPPQQWALQVALLLREPAGPPPDQRAIGVGLLGVLNVLARESPVLVAIDEAQWVDAASAGVLEFAIRRLDGRRVKVLAAIRTEEHEAAPLHLERALADDQLGRIPLGPLSLGALHRLLRARLGIALPRPSLVRVHEASAGNPLYAIELGRALVERERPPEAGRHLSIPATLDGLLRARLARLPGSVRHVLAAAAAMSNPTVSALAAITADGLAGLLPDLDAATAAGIVQVEEDLVRFTHPLLASSAYWHAGIAERRSLHVRLAEISSTGEERARHLALAADGPNDDVAAALDSAAQQAAARGAAVAAADLAELAAALTPRSSTGDLQRRQAQLAQRYIEAGDWTRARDILERLLPELPAGGSRADVLWLLSRTHDDTDEQAALSRAALEEPGDDPARVARIHRRLAEAAARAMDQRAALEHARAAARAGEATDDAATLASDLAYVSLFETFLGEITPGLLERAVALEERAGYLSEYESPSFVMGYRLILHDRFDEARGWLEAADVRALAHGDFASRLTIALHLAELEIGAGAWERAAEHAAMGYSLADELDSDHARSALLYVTAKVDALLGRLDAARAAAMRGIELAQASKTEIYEFNNRRVLAFVALSVDDPAGAVAYFAPLLEFESVRSRRAGFHAVLPDAIEAFVGVGDTDRAGELLALLDETAQALDRPYLIACVARCRGLLLARQGDVEAALTAFSEGLEAHERLPNPFERARTQLAMGRVQRQARQRRAARQSLESALAIFTELGAARWADQARRELARIGGRAPSTGGLTPMEERVAALVAEGKTNREAADLLYLSDHTIEGHLSRVYAKLGVRSRAELAHQLSTDPAWRPRD